MWDLNLLRVDDAATIAAPELARDADALQSALAFRNIEVGDAAVARRLGPGLQELGYRRTELAVMARPTTGLPEALGVAVAEAGLETVAPLRDAWLRSDPVTADPATLAAVAASDRLIAARVPTRVLCARVDGAPASYCLLLAGGQIDDVFTLPEHRGRGLATAVLGAALRAAAAEGETGVFLLADADGRARELYERLGFTAVGSLWSFLRLIA